MMAETFTLHINGHEHTVSTDPRRPLLDVLREDLGLTGAKFGCGERQCGACTVLVGGRPIFSCSTRVATVAGREIETIEGLADGETLHPLQQAFLDEGVAQCGYCMPGMIMTAVSLLKSDANPTEEKIRSEMQRNVCRCGTYTRIIAAVQRVAGGGA
jgi:aerobic-type carbon monoxide dehydrogenase small subunit (CoxS/CutS family)